MSSRPWKMTLGEGDATSGVNGGLEKPEGGPVTSAPGSTSISLMFSRSSRTRGEIELWGARPSFSRRDNSVKFTTAERTRMDAPAVVTPADDGFDAAAAVDPPAPVKVVMTSSREVHHAAMRPNGIRLGVAVLIVRPSLV